MSEKTCETPSRDMTARMKRLRLHTSEMKQNFDREFIPLDQGFDILPLTPFLGCIFSLQDGGRDSRELTFVISFPKKLSREFNFIAFSRFILIRISIEVQLIDWCHLL